MGYDPNSFDTNSFDTNSFEFGTEVVGPVFLGPSIADLFFLQNQAISAIDFSVLFGGAGLTFTAVGALPTGLSLSSAGVLTGTPTVLGATSGLQVRASDGTNPDALSNAFSITVLVAPQGGTRIRSRYGFGVGLG